MIKTLNQKNKILVLGGGMIFSLVFLLSVNQAQAASFILSNEVENLTLPSGTKTMTNSYAGDVLEYRLKIKNISNSTLSNILISNTLAEQLHFVEPYPEISGTSAGNSLVWKMESIYPGDSKIVLVRAKAKSVNKAVSLKNSFTVRAGSVTKTSNETTTILNPSLVSLEIGADKDVVRKNEEIVYTINYRNTGLADLRDVVLRVVLSDDIKMTYSSLRPSSDKNNVLLFSLGDLKKNESGVVSVNAKALRRADAGDSLVATVVLNFTGVFGSLRPGSLDSVSTDVVEGKATNNQTANAGSIFCIGESVWIFNILLFLILFLIFSVFYLFFRVRGFS